MPSAAAATLNTPRLLVIPAKAGESIIPATAHPVIPANAGIQKVCTNWIPAFAGMTEQGVGVTAHGAGGKSSLPHPPQPHQPPHPDQRAERISRQIVPACLTAGEGGLVEFVGNADGQRTQESQHQQRRARHARKAQRQTDQHGEHREENGMNPLVPRRGNKTHRSGLCATHEQARHQQQQADQCRNTQHLQTGRG